MTFIFLGPRYCPRSDAVPAREQVELPLTANVVDWARGPQPEHANVRQMIQGNGAQRSCIQLPGKPMCESKQWHR